MNDGMQRLSRIGADQDEAIARRKEHEAMMRKVVNIAPYMGRGSGIYCELKAMEINRGLAQGKLSGADVLRMFGEEGALPTTAVLGHDREGVRELPVLDSVYRGGHRSGDTCQFLLQQDESDGSCRVVEGFHTSRQGTYATRELNRPIVVSVHPYFEAHSNVKDRDRYLSATSDKIANYLQERDAFFKDAESTGSEVSRNRAKAAERELARTSVELIGFGHAALKRGDVFNAVHAYRLSGMIEHPKVVGRLEDYASQDEKQAMQVRDVLKSTVLNHPVQYRRATCRA